MRSELCKKFDKLNLRIIAKTEVIKMEADSTLLYSRIFRKINWKMRRSRK
jgi:hypothetical protein